MLIKQEKITKSFDRISKNGKKHTITRTKTICVLKCNHCKDIFKRDLSSVPVKRRSNEYHHYCDKCKKYTYLSGHESKQKNLEAKIGEKRIDSVGYVNVYVGRGYKYSRPHGGSLREHIVIMEEHIGRRLKSGKNGRRPGNAEVVHHIDGNKTNNCLDNLDLCTVQEHNSCHARIEKLIFELYEKDMVGYDRETKTYYLK